MKQPYILEVKEENEKCFIKYAAVIGRMEFRKTNRELLNLLEKLPSSIQRQISRHCQLPVKFICIVFNILDNHLASLGGYFLVEPHSLYDCYGVKVSIIQLTNKDESK